jgi:hypothetical protein
MLLLLDLNWHSSVGVGGGGAVWPNASSTGVPAGTTLTPTTPPGGALETSSNGQVIQDLDIDGAVVITHNNVTIRRCRVTSDSFVGVLITSGGATGAIVEDCEILSDLSGGCKGVWVDGVANSNATIRRCNIHTVEDAVYLSGSHVTVADNYFHDLAAPPGDPHHDGVQLASCTNVTITGNNLDLGTDISSCFTTNETSSIVLDGNRMSSDGYVIRFELPSTGITITDNSLDALGFGYGSFEGLTGGATISGNVDDETGANIDAALLALLP